MHYILASADTKVGETVTSVVFEIGRTICGNIHGTNFIRPHDGPDILDVHSKYLIPTVQLYKLSQQQNLFWPGKWIIHIAANRYARCKDYREIPRGGRHSSSTLNIAPTSFQNRPPTNKHSKLHHPRQTPNAQPASPLLSARKKGKKSSEAQHALSTRGFPCTELARGRRESAHVAREGTCCLHAKSCSGRSISIPGGARSLLAAASSLYISSFPPARGLSSTSCIIHWATGFILEEWILRGFWGEGRPRFWVEGINVSTVHGGMSWRALDLVDWGN